MKAEQQQTPLKPIMIKYQGSQMQKQPRLRGTGTSNERIESKRIKTEASDVNITSDQIMLQREEYGDKTSFKIMKKFTKDDMMQPELQQNNNIDNMHRIPTEENNRTIKKIASNQQQQYLEFWQQQSKKGKYIDQLPVINNQNMTLPSVGPLKTPQNQTNVNQYSALNDSKIRNLSAASRDPLKTPQIKQIQASTTSNSNKKNNFYLKVESTNLTPLENVTQYSQISGENSSPDIIGTRSHSPINGYNKTILRSYTIERGNAIIDEPQLDKSILKEDSTRRNSQMVQRVLNRSQTKTPSKNQQQPSLQPLTPNGSNLGNNNGSGLNTKIKYNQNHLQQMRNLQNSQVQQQQHNHDMYNFYYNQDSQNMYASKRNSSKPLNTQPNGIEKEDLLQQQIQEKYQLNRPAKPLQTSGSINNNKFNRNTPLRDRTLDISNEILNKSDNCLLSPLKLSPIDHGEPLKTSSGTASNLYEPQFQDRIISSTTAKQIQAPPTFKKTAKLKLRSKENLDQLSLNEGRNIKTEGSVIDPMPVISQVQKQPYKGQLNQSQQLQISSTKKSKQPLNLKEAFFVKYNKRNSQKNIEEQNEILKNLSQMDQGNNADHLEQLDENSFKLTVGNTSEYNNKTELSTATIEKDKNITQNNNSNFNFYELDATIQREESIVMPQSDIKQIEKEILEDQNKQIKQDQNEIENNDSHSKQENQTFPISEIAKQKEFSTPSKDSNYNQQVLELNSEKLPTLYSSQTETPNRSRQMTIYSPDKGTTNQDNQNQHLTTSPTRNNSQDNGKKPLLKVKLNLETLIFIEEKLFLIYEQVQFHDNISYVHTCKDYLELITSCEQERLEEWINKMEEIISTRRPSIPPQNSVLFLQNSFGKGISLISPVMEMYPDLKKIVNDIFRDLEKSSTQTLITNLLEFFAKKINNYELSRQLGMQDELEGPYLPPPKNDNGYTLVLDLDETLIHFVDTPVGGHFLIRPYLEQFLKEMSKIYEIVIFTVGMQNYANWVIDSFDKNKHISHRLYRQHAFSKQYNYVKDLSKLGRDLSKSLIIDNVADNFRLQPSNGILIKSWFQDQADLALKELIPVLKELVKSKPVDIRPIFKQLKTKYASQRLKHYFTLPM